ncbi:malate dehydrogenase [Holospora obtusa F1]|uniref:Malate dehydrogenase n=1 Tax=Holospora obtusa F1 TaxID=1399147 RepID=W6TEZ3_HOLOB|nr:hypothetical protein [Holospora obtusa]ETZ07484.1 malate dehydrogenase [Holospora obtusa F1]
MKRIGIIGVGNIGATLAHIVLQSKISAHIGLYDVNKDALQGKLWDLEEASVIGGYEGNISIIHDLDAFELFDVLVITAGRPRVHGMDRKDLLKENASILQAIAREVKNFKGVCVIVTNPVDLMTRFFSYLLSLPKTQVLGMAGVLDEARMALQIKSMTGLKVQSMRTCVVGPHSEHMIPLEAVGIGPGVLTDIMLISEEQKKLLNKNTRFGGGRIVEKLKSGSAFYGPAAACFRILQNVLELKQEVLTCSVFMGENSKFSEISQEIFFGWPVFLGKEGVKKMITPKMNEKEKEELREVLGKLQKEYLEFFESMV